MNTKTISGKVAIVFIIFVVVIFSSVIFISLQDRVVADMEKNLVEQTYPGIKLANQIKFHTVQVQQWLTDISATRAQGGLNDGFDEAEKSAVLFRDSVDKLRILLPQERERLDKISAAFEPYYEVGKKMAQNYIDHGPAVGNKTMAEFDAVVVSINERVDELADELDGRVDSSWEVYDTARSRVFSSIMISGLILIATFLLLGYLVRNMITAMKEMSGEFILLGQGDFATRVRTIDARNDELGEMGRNISTMKHQLRDMVTEIGESATLLNSCINSMTEITNRTMLSVQQQQMETEQVASAVTEMSANSIEVSGNAAMAAESAQGADQSANDGNNVVQKTVGSIESLATSVTNASEVIHQLEQDSESIGSILDVIRGIAEQTNLLALNAAIEAARAGEQGRGFAVVADEVRTLASRTQDATGEIQTMIQQLQSGATHAVTVMESGREKTKESVELVLNAQNNLKEIMSAVKTISDMTTQIAAAAEEQSTVAEEVSRNTNNMSNENTRNAGSVQEIVNSTEELASLSQRLDHAVSSFKI